MTWIPHSDMAAIHRIRQDFARARQAAEQEPTAANIAAYTEAWERRARAIRAVHREDGATPTQLSAIFRCSKSTIREVLAAQPV